MADRLDAMQTFAAVCDEGGFAAAARRLRVSPSVVTRAVAALESRLGVRLLHRTTRSIRLTDVGAQFLERARRILTEVDEAERAAQDERATPRGRIVVAAPRLFGRLHVAPLVSAFLEAHPETSAELVLSDSFASLVEEGIDLAIRIGTLADSGLIARRLGETRQALAASPAYLAAHGGAPRSPADLAGHSMIAFRGFTRGQTWVFRDARGEPLTVDVAPRLATNSGDAAIDHAVRHGGITAAFCYQLDPHVRSGALVEVLQGFALAAVPIQMVVPSSKLLSVKVRAFRDLAERAARAWRFLGAG